MKEARVRLERAVPRTRDQTVAIQHEACHADRWQPVKWPEIAGAGGNEHIGQSMLSDAAQIGHLGNPGRRFVYLT